MGSATVFMDYIQTLTDRKAFMLFSIGFTLGILVLIFEISVMVCLPAIVLAYTGLLFAAQRRFFVSLALETKNSPYFLGFLFTLACLIKIFMLLPGQDYPEQSDLFIFLVPQVGAALSTTIFGLIGRHLIVCFDPAEEEQQELWKMATTELRKNSTAYQKSQQRLLSLIDEFVTAHNELLEQEEEASRRHITVLSEASSALGILSKEYPEKIKSFLEVFDAIQNRVDLFMDETLPKVHKDLTEGTSFQLQKLYNDFIKVAKSSFTKMSSNLEGLDTRIEEFNNSFRNTFNKIPETHNSVLKESADQLQEFQNGYIKGLTVNFESINAESMLLAEQIKETVANVTQCNAVFEGKFNQNLDEAGGKLKDFSELSEKVNSINSDVLNGLTGQITSFEQVFSDRLSTFQAEIKQIDGLIDAFIEATKKRLIN